MKCNINHKYIFLLIQNCCSKQKVKLIYQLLELKMGGLCSSDTEMTFSLQKEIQLYLQGCQILNADKMIIKSKEVVSYIYLKIKINMLGCLVKQIKAFDESLNINNKSSTKLDIVALYSKYCQQIVTMLKTNKEKFNGQIRQYSQKLKKIEYSLSDMKSLYEPERVSIKVQKVQNISPKYVRQRNSQLQRNSSSSKRTSAFELQMFNDTYSFPREVVELNKKSLEIFDDDLIQDKIEMLEQSNRILNRKILDDAEQQRKLKMQINQLSKNKIDLKDIIQTQEDCIQSLKKDVEDLQSFKKILNKSYEDETIKNSLLIQQLQNVKKQLNSIKFLKKTTDSQTQIQQEIGQLAFDKESRMKNVKPPKESQQFLFSGQSKKHLRKLSSSYQTILRLFVQSSILPTYKDLQQATFTRYQISDLLEKQVTRSKLLFSYDQITKNHFEKYIHNVNNILILIQLENGIKIGGFAGQINEQNLLKESFLFCLKNGASPIKLETKNKVNKINADRNYINFGNGQIKIKARCLTLQTNISGFQCEYFWNGKGASRLQFLGVQDTKVQMKNYEIFKIYFE